MPAAQDSEADTPDLEPITLGNSDGLILGSTHQRKLSDPSILSPSTTCAPIQYTVFLLAVVVMHVITLEAFGSYSRAYMYA